MAEEKDSVRAEVMRLHYLEGLPIRAIARRLSLARRTVKRHLGTLVPREKSVQPRASLLEPFDARIRTLLEETPELRAPQIIERLRPAGYTGGISILRERIRKLRPVHHQEAFLTLDFVPGQAADRKKSRGRYLALHDLTFLDQGINPLFIGIPGTGKTFLARALAYKACQSTRRVVFVSAPKMLNELHGAELHGRIDRVLAKYVRADLLVIDDFACLEMDATQAKLAFQVISERYDYRRSTGITTNRPFKDWPKVFPDALNAQVIAERLTERSEHFVFNGKGYRTKL